MHEDFDLSLINKGEIDFNTRDLLLKPFIFTSVQCALDYIYSQEEHQIDKLNVLEVSFEDPTEIIRAIDCAITGCKWMSFNAKIKKMISIKTC